VWSIPDQACALDTVFIDGIERQGVQLDTPQCFYGILVQRHLPRQRCLVMMLGLESLRSSWITKKMTNT
jgi:hypothetical protein